MLNVVEIDLKYFCSGFIFSTRNKANNSVILRDHNDNVHVVSVETPSNRQQILLLTPYQI